MLANWSLILNVLLLIAVMVAIGRLMKARRQSLSLERSRPAIEPAEKSVYNAQPYNDDIIAVRKVQAEPSLNNFSDVEEEMQLFKKSSEKSAPPRLMPHCEERIELRKTAAAVADAPIVDAKSHEKEEAPSTIMMFLLAKENRQFAGYELLQTVLAAGLRFGEGHLFHRHQFTNGQGPVLCSLAAATATGVFDLQNIGAFSVRGLCLFMQASKNSSIDMERFAVMLETAKQLSEGMDAYLLDDQRKPLTEERIARYHRLLQNHQMQEDTLVFDATQI